ncbi:mandelate racemase/muconate lactonizing enzyme family protein [Streptomyces althioticus]|jgi:L-alanine-DL-glutamate epimerase-like enolase superfamily enzyme|uniref:Mandelate racemase/muconate lactonizing enzyme family protein n=1 Tax=Actinospica acidiphila TaxID=304899 RepID=A0A9X5HFT6_9ACTN|nr:mandelate racemase/muconate lactonizing enzyme family protein [Actinospica acidiphila]ALV48261.1 mandelate racemase [Streptomyces sp. 4F]MBM4832921.1 mandelate racemase/muconate lactonizing enzyme family protein [Actinospica acidiphila]MCC9690477.1 mandelate racemase/muconate lactonizing enzyme family protein [Streptomyces sp. MNU103]NEC53073.1 mandelate racemase/muconate lactonizing enzyme family protein [Actinospica acidiphila]
MKITRVETCGLRGATPEGGWSNELRPDDVVHTLVAVHTDEGITGIGSAFTSETLVRGAIDLLLPHLVGQDPVEVERITETLHQTAFWMGRGGALTHATSAIDIALWDVAGQALGQPVGRLLGGRHRARVRPYASVLMDEAGPMTDNLTQLVEQGFTAFKIGWWKFGRVDAATDERTVAAARTAIGDRLLAVDAGGSEGFFPGDLAWAKRTARMLADYDVAWFEEALAPDDLEGFAELRAGSPVPISGGEVLTRRQSFAPYLRCRAFDIVQPDTTKGGGLSESRRIGWAAQDLGIRLIPHGWNTAIGLAADLQLSSALASTDIVEYKTGSAYVDDLVTGGWPLDADGYLDIPSGPGLGVSLDQEAVEKYGTRPQFAA